MPRKESRTRRWRLMAAAAAEVTVLAGCATPAGATTPRAEQTATAHGSGCAWPIEDSYLASNSGLPDTAAWYWGQSFAIHPGTQVVFSGVYPDARYASFTVYSSSELPFTSNGVASWLSDYQIAPDRGSVNPWRGAGAPGGHFTLDLRMQVSRGQVNVLPLAPAGVTSGVGYLEYRVFLPATENASHVPLPHITVEERGSAQQLRACTSHTTAIPPPVRQTTTTQGTAPSSRRPSLPAPLQFFRAKFQTYFPNPETAYLLAYTAPPTASQVVVVTGKAPTSPPGAHPSTWPSASDQVRYWSMCVNIGEGTDPVVVNHLRGRLTDLGCRADDATKLSASGTYTYVIGTEAQRAAIERVAGATFLPLSLAQPPPLYLLAMRYTLANPSFRSAPQNIIQTLSAPAAAQTMGAYYPHARLCSLSALSAGGAPACG
ncbi:MAG TPA: hypothetical protein VK425_13005 [Acidimicrobiales bacterium]|nr:hypothetical protein [Acidimicrobiales bacterium]